MYGPILNASEYLQKFIGVECRLPKDEEGDDYARFCGKLQNEYNILKLKGFPFAHYAEAFQLSLRDIQRWFSLLNLYYASLSKYEYNNHYITIFIAAVKVKRSDIFQKLKTGTIGIDELEKQLYALLLCQNTRTAYIGGEFFQDLMKYLKEPPSNELIQSLIQYDIHPRDVIPNICKKLEFFSISAP